MLLYHIFLIQCVHKPWLFLIRFIWMNWIVVWAERLMSTETCFVYTFCISLLLNICSFHFLNYNTVYSISSILWESLEILILNEYYSKILAFTYTVIILKTVYIQVQEYTKSNIKRALHIKVSPTQRNKEICFSKRQSHSKESRVKFDQSHSNSLGIHLCNIWQGRITRATVKLPSHHKHTSKS